MATSYTSNKKIGALDSASTPLAATNEIVINQNGDILKTPLSAVEAKVFDAKTQTTTPTGTEVTIVRQTDGSLRQVPLANIVPALNITNAQISNSAAIVDTKLDTINTAGKVTNNAVQAVSTNTANRVVARDGSGNFAAGTITATLSGNASTATTLQTGRTIALTGDVTYTSPSFDGSANVTAASTIANNAVTTAKIADSNVTTAKIADSNVTTAKIADSNVTTAKIADGAVTSAKIADGTIVTADLADGAVTSAKIADGTVATADLADGAVTSAKIADGTIVNGDIANTTITDAKLATISTAGKVSNSATTATNANTGNAIVARDASGNFSAGTITANITGNVSGNAGTVTDGLYTNAVQINTAQKSFQAGNSGMATATGGLNTLEVVGTGGAAMITFHRPGAHAAYVGIDSDNQLKVGGWSLGANAYPILTSGNYNSYAPTLTGGGASGAWGIRAYARRSDGQDINFYWSGQSGQPPWLWGSTDGQNFYVWNPSNFNVNYANSAGNGVPPGAIMPFAMNSAPSGWLAADGSAVSRSTYATLFAAISTTHGVGDGSTTFNLPDLRGIFVRGSGSQTISGKAYSGTFAGKQGPNVQAHDHSAVYIASVTGGPSAIYAYNGTINSHPAVSATETRPANIALLYCIKF